MDFRPTCSRVLIENHAQNFCKLLSGNSKLTVKCLTGKRFGKPRRSMNRVTLAGDQLTACPECADTVKFFTHPPAQNVISLFPGFCKHQWRFLDIRRESKELLLIGVKKPFFKMFLTRELQLFLEKTTPLSSAYRVNISICC